MSNDSWTMLLCHNKPELVIKPKDLCIFYCLLLLSAFLPMSFPSISRVYNRCHGIKVYIRHKKEGKDTWQSILGYFFIGAAHSVFLCFAECPCCQTRKPPSATCCKTRESAAHNMPCSMHKQHKRPCILQGLLLWVEGGARTHDIQNHNLTL